MRDWYSAVLQQMAAESYLNGWSALSLQDRVRRLELGNNNFQIESNQAESPILPGTTRMTATQAEEFLTRYEIVSHLPNTASGFSATLMREIGTDIYTLAFRSTEYRPSEAGGDRERDFGANREIAFKGFAFGQIASMEIYYEHLLLGETFNPNSSQWEHDAKLEDFTRLFGGGRSDGTLNVSGYSLSGNLASVFTALHSEV